MGLPTAPIVDYFNRPNETPIAAPWSGANVTITSNALLTNAASTTAWRPDLLGTDVEVGITWSSGGTRYVQIGARKASGGLGVVFECVKDSQNYKIWEDGVVIGSAVAGTVAFGDTFILQVIGDTAKGFRIPAGGSPVEILSRTLSTRLNSGYVDLFIRETTQVFDDFRYHNLSVFDPLMRGQLTHPRNLV